MILSVRRLGALAVLLTAALSSPALADHAGPSGGVATGGGINVISAGTLDEGQGAALVRFGLNQPDRLSDGELLSRDAAGIDAHSGRNVFSTSAAIAYGVSHRLTLSAELSFVQRAAIRGIVGGAVANRGTSAGIGDLTLLAKYRLTSAGTWGIAILGGVKAPTGATHRLDAAGDRFETEHQPGTGSWDPIFGVAASLGKGNNALDASFIYQAATTGAQATRLGDRAQTGIALSHRFGPAAPMHHQHDADGDADAPHHTHRQASFDALVELVGELETRERLSGVFDDFTGSRVLWLAPGARLTTASGWTISGSGGVPLAQHVRPSHPDNHYRMSVSIGRAF